MSRSIYRRIRALAGRAPTRVSRRDFLATGLAGAAIAVLPRRLTATALWPDGKRVVIVGGGFAGLSCAHELKAMGYDVTVVEAREQVGGRVRSNDKFVAGRNVEFGGELIGSNHPTWVRYQKEFGLEFLELSEDETLEQPVWLDGKRLTREDAKKLLEEMDEAFLAIDEEAKAVVEDEPWKTPSAEGLDKRSTLEWVTGLKASDLCKKGLTVEFYSNNGQELAKQSFLGNLCQVKGHGGAKSYRDESEIYRCKGGNQKLAFALAEKIGRDRVILGLPVTRIEHGGKGVVVHCKDNRTIECDDVVLAVPPSVWSKIDIQPGLPKTLAPQMGKNTKFFVPLKSRFWKKGGLEQYAMSDGLVSMTWEGTDAQEGDGNVVMVGFSGAQAAAAASAIEPGDRAVRLLDEMDKLYPGIKDEVAGKTAFMDWPNEPWTKASYSFPAPGQITTLGPILHKGLGKLHFAGEHTCYRFVGYMEGALYSGASLALRLGERDGVLAGAGRR